MHVTVSFNGDARALARLLALFANLEDALYATTGTHRREEGHYARKIKYMGEGQARSTLVRDSHGARYYGLNLTHVAAGRNRVEFRLFSGSLNPIKIAAWIQLCLGPPASRSGRSITRPPPAAKAKRPATASVNCGECSTSWAG